jgi:hypothetical protein
MKSAMSAWSLWRAPRCAVAVILLVDLAAACTAFFSPTSIRLSDLGTAALLGSLSIV